MADEFTRNKLYEYGANSNLVLEADRDSRARREDEGKGEVETLNGRLDHIRMGDRLAVTAAKKREKDQKDGENDLESNLPKKKKLGTVQSGAPDSSKNVFFSSIKGATSILSQTEDLELLSYRPKTRETKAAYEELLRITQIIIGDQPQDILKGAADEILSILKDDSLKDFTKQKELTKISANMNNDLFYKVVTIGKRITDYRIKGANDEKQDQDDTGKPNTAYVDEEMAVVFDDEDDAEAEQDEEVLLDGEGNEYEEGVEADAKGQLKGKAENDDGTGGADDDDRYKLSIHDIDAHWLQRQLSKFYSDANVSSKLAEDTLATLQIADERICENKLVVLLDFDKFEFIKLLMKNRAKIYFCTKLKQAQNDQERAAVEEEIMKGHPELLLLIQQKASAESWIQDRIGEFANKARREARALNKEGGKESTGLSKGRDDSDANDANADSSDGLLQKFYSEEQNPLFSAGMIGTGMLNLDDYVFNDGGHFMANQRCELPEKSWRAQKKGYEEVHVPALRPKLAPNEKLVQVADLPEWVQPTFSTLNVRSLNRVQSKMVQAALNESHNLLLCAPTGAGKTNVALMCMLHEIGKHRREDGTIDLDAFKIVYVAPMKALVQECVLSFSKRLEPYGISVKELSGDQNLTRQQIQKTQVIITTPEKWDIVTRKAGDRTYTQLVRLMIIDEIHLLHDERGAVLESLIARTIRQIENSQEMVRMVGLSATLPNYEDVATFLRVDHDKGLFFFDNSYRPVPLQQQYIGITEKKALKRFQLMNEICYEKVLQQAGKNQVLIFTHSRAETAKTAIGI